MAVTVPGKTHWHILGAGAMGCLWAAYLRRAGYPVTLLLKPGKAVRNPQTLLLETPEQQSLAVCTAHSANHAIHYLLVCTKATDTVDAVLAHRDTFTTDTRVVLLQNGMGQHQALMQALPDIRIYAALSTDGAWLREAFHIVHAGQGMTRIGACSSHADREHLLAAVQGIDHCVEWIDDIAPALWLKLAINCAINGLTAIHDCLNGELLDNGTRQAAMHVLCEEVARVMQAEGIATHTDALYRAAIDTAAKTAHNRSSTLQDIRAGRRTEIIALNGFIGDRGKQHGIDTPANDAIVSAIQHLESRTPH